MHSKPPARTKTKNMKSDAPAVGKVTQVEVYNLDGMTVQGLQHLRARFGQKRNGLCHDLIERINAEMDVRGARCAVASQ